MPRRASTTKPVPPVSQEAVAARSESARRDAAGTSRFVRELNAALTESLGGGYAAARSSRLRQEYGGHPRSADSLLELDRERLVEFSRGLYNATPVYRPFIDRLVDLTLGTGIMPRAATDSPAGKAVALFDSWATDPLACDEAGLRTFGEMQRLVLRETLIAGDSPVVWTSAQRMQAIEPERLYVLGRTAPGDDNPGGRITDGVEVDAAGRPLRFHFTSWTLTGSSRGAETTTVDARDVLFACNRERCGQTRGVPIMAPALDRIAMLDENHLTVHVACTVAAMFAAVITSEAPQQIAGRFAQPESSGEASAGDGAPMRSIAGKAGIIASLRPGEEIKTVQGSQPAGGWEVFTRASLTLIAACAGMPVETALMDVSKANFSVSRMAELMSRNTADHWRQLMRDALLRPVWRRFVLGQIAAGALDAQTPLEEYMAVEWPEPRRRMLDPQKEIAAYVTARNENLLSHDDIVWELGFGDPEQIRNDRARERQAERDLNIVPPAAAGAAPAPAQDQEPEDDAEPAPRPDPRPGPPEPPND